MPAWIDGYLIFFFKDVFILYFIHAYMCVLVWVYMHHVPADAHGGKMRA